MRKYLYTALCVVVLGVVPTVASAGVNIDRRIACMKELSTPPVERGTGKLMYRIIPQGIDGAYRQYTKYAVKRPNLQEYLQKAKANDTRCARGGY